MAIRGHHRVRSGARLLAVPVIVATLVAVVAAVLVGHVAWIAAAAGLAVVSCVLVALAFDRELVLARRSHAEDRAKLARLYAERYAAWRRFGRASQLAATEEAAPGDATSDDAVPEDAADDAVPEDAVDDAVPDNAALADVVTEGAGLEDTATGDTATGDTATDGAAPESQVVVDAGPASSGEVSAAASDPIVASAVAPGPAFASEHDLWPDLADAPTVVDLAGWEERVRGAAEERAAEDRVSEVDDRRYA